MFIPLYIINFNQNFSTQINPAHTIPTFIDGDLTITDSHATIAYLVGKFGTDESLYPKDLAKRALVDQRMYFEAGILFQAMRDIAVSNYAMNILYYNLYIHTTL